MTDRYGLAVSTSSAAARAAYVEAVDLLLAALPGAEEAFGRALDADPRFALAEAGLARAEPLFAGFAYSRGRVTGLLRSAERSAACVTSMTWRACSGVTSTGRSRATASMKWMVSACIGPW